MFFSPQKQQVFIVCLYPTPGGPPPGAHPSGAHPSGAHPSGDPFKQKNMGGPDQVVAIARMMAIYYAPPA